MNLGKTIKSGEMHINKTFHQFIANAISSAQNNLAMPLFGNIASTLSQPSPIIADLPWAQQNIFSTQSLEVSARGNHIDLHKQVLKLRLDLLQIALEKELPFQEIHLHPCQGAACRILFIGLQLNPITKLLVDGIGFTVEFSRFGNHLIVRLRNLMHLGDGPNVPIANVLNTFFSTLLPRVHFSEANIIGQEAVISIEISLFSELSHLFQTPLDEIKKHIHMDHFEVAIAVSNKRYQTLLAVEPSTNDEISLASYWENKTMLASSSYWRDDHEFALASFKVDLLNSKSVDMKRLNELYLPQDQDTLISSFLIFCSPQRLQNPESRFTRIRQLLDLFDRQGAPASEIEILRYWFALSLAHAWKGKNNFKALESLLVIADMPRRLSPHIINEVDTILDTLSDSASKQEWASKFAAALGQSPNGTYFAIKSLRFNTSLTADQIRSATMAKTNTFERYAFVIRAAVQNLLANHGQNEAMQLLQMFIQLGNGTEEPDSIIAPIFAEALKDATPENILSQFLRIETRLTKSSTSALMLRTLDLASNNITRAKFHAALGLYFRDVKNDIKFASDHFLAAIKSGWLDTSLFSWLAATLKNAGQHQILADAYTCMIEQTTDNLRFEWMQKWLRLNIDHDPAKRNEYSWQIYDALGISEPLIANVDYLLTHKKFREAGRLIYKISEGVEVKSTTIFAIIDVLERNWTRYSGKKRIAQILISQIELMYQLLQKQKQDTWEMAIHALRFFHAADHHVFAIPYALTIIQSTKSSASEKALAINTLQVTFEHHRFALSEGPYAQSVLLALGQHIKFGHSDLLDLKSHIASIDMWSDFRLVIEHQLNYEKTNQEWQYWLQRQMIECLARHLGDKNESSKYYRRLLKQNPGDVSLRFEYLTYLIDEDLTAEEPQELMNFLEQESCVIDFGKSTVVIDRLLLTHQEVAYVKDSLAMWIKFFAVQNEWSIAGQLADLAIMRNLEDISHYKASFIANIIREDLDQAIRRFLQWFKQFTTEDELNNSLIELENQLRNVACQYSFDEIMVNIAPHLQELGGLGAQASELVVRIMGALQRQDDITIDIIAFIDEIHDAIFSRESRLWIPAYILIKDYGDQVFLHRYLERVIPLLESRPSILNEYPFTIESLRSEYMALNNADLTPSNNSIHPAVKAAPITLKDASNSQNNHPLHLHLETQRQAIQTGNFDLLEKLSWKVWRFTEQIGYELNGVDRYPTAYRAPNTHSDLRSALNRLNKIITMVYASKFKATVQARAIGIKPADFESRLRSLDWNHSVFQKSLLSNKIHLFSRQKILFLNVQGLNSAIIFEPETRRFFIDAQYYKATPPSHLFHRVMKILWEVKLGYFATTRLDAKNELLPTLNKIIDTANTIEGKNPIHKFLQELVSSKSAAITELMTSELQAKCRKLTNVSASAIRSCQEQMLQHVYRLQLAETLDLIGLCESILDVDLLKRPDTSAQLKRDSIQNLLDFAGKLKL